MGIFAGRFGVYLVGFKLIANCGEVAKYPLAVCLHLLPALSQVKGRSELTWIKEMLFPKKLSLSFNFLAVVAVFHKNVWGSVFEIHGQFKQAVLIFCAASLKFGNAGNFLRNVHAQRFGVRTPCHDQKLILLQGLGHQYALLAVLLIHAHIGDLSYAPEIQYLQRYVDLLPGLAVFHRALLWASWATKLILLCFAANKHKSTENS